MNRVASRQEFTHDAGHAVLDLANTVDERRGDMADLLVDYDALVRWCRGAGFLTGREATTLLRAAKAEPATAERVLVRARELREACFAILEAASRDDHYPPKSLELLHKGYYEMVTHRTLKPGADRVEWVWTTPPDELDRMLWPIIDLATEFVTSNAVKRVRACQGNTCARLFLDNSRQGNRRWCDMGRCGNRAKARRFYEKSRGARTED